VTGQNTRALPSFEQRFDNEGAWMSTTAQTTALRPGRGTPRVIVARQVQQQRMLWNCLTPLGVCLSTAILHKLAADITAGRPAELP
jgi:hypothetical protein